MEITVTMLPQSFKGVSVMSSENIDYFWWRFLEIHVGTLHLILKGTFYRGLQQSKFLKVSEA